MNEQILPILLWLGLGALFLLSLPIPPLQKLLLVASSWLLRLGAVALLVAGAYLGLQPGALPAEVARALADFPGVLSLLPPVGSAAFGPALACLLVAPLVPLIAAFDFAARKPRPAVLAETEPEPAPVRPRKRQVEAVAEAPRPRSEPVPEPEVLPEAPEVEEPVPVGVPLMRPIERREAAGAIASAARRPLRPAN
jgi:hypothetical protein